MKSADQWGAGAGQKSLGSSPHSALFPVPRPHSLLPGEADRHSVVVSTAPIGLNWICLQSKHCEMKTENWLPFPAVSCSPTGAKHNINQAAEY